MSVIALSFVVYVGLTGCGTAPPPPPPVDTDPPVAAKPPPPPPPPLATPPFSADDPIGPVFPAEGGGFVVPKGAGRIVAVDGVFPVPAGAPCGDAIRITHPAEVVAFLPPGDALVYPDVPATLATQVERFAWRIGDVLGPRAGLHPGGVADVDPSTWEGITVRSIKKTRRSGPPLLIGVGDRDGTVVVAVTDRDADKTLASVTLSELPGAVPNTVPAFDADGDKVLDVFAYGHGPGGWFRARVAVDPVDPVRAAGSPTGLRGALTCP